MGIYDRATREKVVLASGNVFLNVMGECGASASGTGAGNECGVSGFGDRRGLAHFPIPGGGDRDGGEDEDEDEGWRWG